MSQLDDTTIPLDNDLADDTTLILNGDERRAYFDTPPNFEERSKLVQSTIQNIRNLIN